MSFYLIYSPRGRKRVRARPGVSPSMPRISGGGRIRAGCGTTGRSSTCKPHSRCEMPHNDRAVSKDGQYGPNGYTFWTSVPNQPP
eukprot:6863686-Prymnesium_polylepis.1